MSDGESAPYIVPLNFGYQRQGERLTLYFHSALEGRKLDLIRRCQIVGFEMDTGHQLHRGTAACNCSFGFQSVIGTGHAALVEDPAEKERALQLLMLHQTGDAHWPIPPQAVNKVAVIRLTVEEISCKRHE